MPSRREALAALVAAGAVSATAWTIPSVLTAKPAEGATLSQGPGELNGDSANEIPAAKPAPDLAFTGLNIQRDAEIGAALIAGGWAMHHWASRTPEVEA